jgi:D-hydroxyproline dehydrogenase subunit beta
VVELSVAAQYDLAIVGGGIVGAWALYLACQRHGDWRIVLIDRFKVGDGATAHSAGVLLATGRSERERRLAGTSAGLYQKLQAAFGFQTTKAEVFWVADAAFGAEIRAAAIGFAIEDVDGASADLDDRLAAPLRMGSAQIVLRGGMAVSHDPGQIASLLVYSSLRVPNVSCIEGAEVKRVQSVASGCELLLDGRTLTAARTLVAVGPWITGDPVGAVARERGIRIKKVVALHVDRPPPANAAAVFFPQSDAYLMPLPARNQWLFSFRSEEWDCEPRKHELEISERDREIAKAVLDRYLPGLSDDCVGGRVFCDAYTPGGETLVAFDHGCRSVVAGAGGGAGFRLAPGIADEALQMIAS